MIERKYLAHYVDAAFSSTGSSTNYVRLGDDLEEFNEDLNPEVNTKKNILGENRVTHSGYAPQRNVEPYYADTSDPLYTKLNEIVQERKTGDACKTTLVDVLLNESGTVVWAYKEDCYIIPSSWGGDTTGVQIPFTVYNAGNRTRVNFDPSTKTVSAYSAPSSTP